VSKRYYPVGLDLEGQRVLVVGGGKVAEGKIDQLLDCGAHVALVSPTATPRLAALATGGQIEWIARPFEPTDVDGAWIVIAAADDRSANAAVARDARAVGRLVNSVDDVPNCDFIAMSVLRRGDVQVSISTGGGSPAMARWLREELESLLPEELGPLLDVLAEVRGEFKAAGQLPPPYAPWRDAIQRILPLLAAGRREEARRVLSLSLRDAGPRQEGAPHPNPLPEGEGMPPGTVYLVGAGPGDPGLLTVRAKELLESADVVIYDRLVDASVLALVSPRAELIDVGKEPGAHCASQSQINALLIAQADQGRQVVRLKGGDPFVFGRGGEEAVALAAAGVPFEVVPGVSAALAAPAYAGIPVTHRGSAPAVAIVTGHGAEGTAVDWDALARSGATLVILMGMANLPTISRRLVEAGLADSTPVAIVQNGTRSNQATLVATLKDIATRAHAAGIGSPATIVVGDVVALREKIHWFDPAQRPLEVAL
jgi:uroporphyrin-III C-methyltransferase/precorrin-2 dehydrogenase/sirohydrochlorin ferrochelatase